MQDTHSSLSRLFSADLSEIVALAKSTVGEEWLTARTENPPRCPDTIYEVEHQRVLSQIRVLGADKVGWICSFASYWGIHNETTDEPSPCPPFINNTGFLDMFRNAPGRQDLKSVIAFPAAMLSCDFIESMEIIATATILAFAYDILQQANWTEEWGKQH